MHLALASLDLISSVDLWDMNSNPGETCVLIRHGSYRSVLPVFSSTRFWGKRDFLGLYVYGNFILEWCTDVTLMERWCANVLLMMHQQCTNLRTLFLEGLSLDRHKICQMLWQHLCNISVASEKELVYNLPFVTYAAVCRPFFCFVLFMILMQGKLIFLCFVLALGFEHIQWCLITQITCKKAL